MKEGSAAGVPAHDVADLALAGEGQVRIDWADAQMPVLGQIRERFAAERPLDGIRVGASLHVTAETANLVRALVAGGADVALCASNPLSTQDDVAAALVDRHGARVYAVQGEDTDTYYRHITTVVDGAPQVTMDDGADLVGVIHGARTDLLDGIVGGTEETTTGVLRMRALEAEGALGFPVVAVNDAQTTRLFDNLHGTGQSTLDGIVRATNVLLAGRTVVVLGYGWCGRGVALRSKGAGASVIVCEVDPVRALQARLDGYEVMPALDAAERGDVFVCVTGDRDVLGAQHFARMRDSAILANAGHFDVEINLPELRDAAVEPPREVRPQVLEHVLEGGRRLHLLAHGRVVNLAAADGHPAAVMDLAFAGQALAAEYLVRHAGELEPKVLALPAELEREIARLKLASLGIEIDELTPAQEDYLTSWEQGT
jgi:adenosylhomocysteinase